MDRVAVPYARLQRLMQFRYVINRSINEALDVQRLYRSLV